MITGVQARLFDLLKKLESTSDKFGGEESSRCVQGLPVCSLCAGSHLAEPWLLWPAVQGDLLQLCAGSYLTESAVQGT